MKKPRHLSPDERALWDRVAERTTPLDPVPRPPAPPLVKPEVPRAAPAQPLPTFKIGAQAKTVSRHDILPPISERLAQAPVNMDARAFGKMKRGKIKPEGRIDLHGMTLAQAHPALIGFILRAQSDGKRLVLVITGKGKDRDDGGPIPARHGVLRHQVPQWMALAPLSSVILQVTPAHLRHGGHGAYYVYLRRGR
jgi:DNA-nicking Smr family endonuclease